MTLFFRELESENASFAARHAMKFKIYDSIQRRAWAVVVADFSLCVFFCCSLLAVGRKIMWLLLLYNSRLQPSRPICDLIYCDFKKLSSIQSLSQKLWNFGLISAAAVDYDDEDNDDPLNVRASWRPRKKVRSLPCVVDISLQLDRLSNLFFSRAVVVVVAVAAAVNWFAAFNI